MIRSQILLITTVFSLISINALADQTTADQTKPIKTEINTRLNKQDSTVNQSAVKDRVSQTQGNLVTKQDQQIRGDVKSFATPNAVRLNKQEQQALNPQKSNTNQPITSKSAADSWSTK